jgi:hypothetical protein
MKIMRTFSFGSSVHHFVTASHSKWAVAAILAFSLTVMGCQSQPVADGEAEPEEGTVQMEGEVHPYSEAIEEAMAELSAEDRREAEQQKICPVSMEPLGSMGVPMRVAAGDREVFICCEGCTTPLQEDPEKYLANLEK